MSHKSDKVPCCLSPLVAKQTNYIHVDDLGDRNNLEIKEYQLITLLQIGNYTCPDQL